MRTGLNLATISFNPFVKRLLEVVRFIDSVTLLEFKLSLASQWLVVTLRWFGITKFVSSKFQQLLSHFQFVNLSNPKVRGIHRFYWILGSRVCWKMCNTNCVHIMRSTLCTGLTNRSLNMEKNLWKMLYFWMFQNFFTWKELKFIVKFSISLNTVRSLQRF